MDMVTADSQPGAPDCGPMGCLLAEHRRRDSCLYRTKWDGVAPAAVCVHADVSSLDARLAPDGVCQAVSLLSRQRMSTRPLTTHCAANNAAFSTFVSST